MFVRFSENQISKDSNLKYSKMCLTNLVFARILSEIDWYNYQVANIDSTVIVCKYDVLRYFLLTLYFHFWSFLHYWGDLQFGVVFLFDFVFILTLPSFLDLFSHLKLSPHLQFEVDSPDRVISLRTGIFFIHRFWLVWGCSENSRFQTHLANTS